MNKVKQQTPVIINSTPALLTDGSFKRKKSVNDDSTERPKQSSSLRKLSPLVVLNILSKRKCILLSLSIKYQSIRWLLPFTALTNDDVIVACSSSLPSFFFIGPSTTTPSSPSTTNRFFSIFLSDTCIL